MESVTPLCDIAFKYGTDKCPQLGHSYTPFYYDLLKDKRETIKKVLEFGIGGPETMPWVTKQGQQYQKGASLLMWRDFFPNAQIYGVDCDPSTIFQSKRITTFLFNTKNSSKLINLIKKIGSDIDLVLDDGDHRGVSHMQVIKAVMPLLKQDCIYIIEDSSDPDYLITLLNEYDCQIGKFSDRYNQNNLLVTKNNLIVVKKK